MRADYREERSSVLYNPFKTSTLATFADNVLCVLGLTHIKSHF